MEHKTQDLLKELNKNLTNANDFKRNFLLSIVRGIGGTIGATIIAGIVLAILSSFVNTVDDIPILHDIISELNLLQEEEK